MVKRRGIYLLLSMLLLAAMTGCSTRKNTTGTRFYHAMTTKYNVYFNGNEAYKAGVKTVEEQNKDNYMDVIPLYPIGNKTSIGIDSAEFNRAIEKAQKAIRQHSIQRKPSRRPGGQYTAEYKQWLAQKEFNPYLHNAWMLMGKAQFYKGDFPEAAATFSYIIRLYNGRADIIAEAGIWLAHCYTRLGSYYEAEDILGKVKNDSLPHNFVSFHSSVSGNLLLEQQRYREALPYLLGTIRKERNKKQKAREYYLLGQVYQQINEPEKAFQAYGKVIKLFPPYKLELNARIRQTEVMPGGDVHKVVHKLQRLADDEKNAGYADQIYYAIGNAYLAHSDTVKAIAGYQAGLEKSTQGGIEKGILWLRLGNVYWQQSQYAKAQTAYTEAIGLIDNEYPGYKELYNRSEILDELVEYTSTVHLQDSLQYLASLSEQQRMRVIEKIIADVARREQEAREAEEKLLQAETRQLPDGQLPGVALSETQTGTTAPNAWYFYNPRLVAQGKTEFERAWGYRKEEDNWRRKNKTVVLIEEFAEVDYNEDADAEKTGKESLVAIPASGRAEIDSYMQQIPLTKKAMKASNTLLTEALFRMALLYKDQLEDYSFAQRTFSRLITQFPDFEKIDEAYYNLFLMHSRLKDTGEAGIYKDLLVDQFPQSKYALLLSDPDYLYHAVHGKHLEDSLYACTYDAYLAGDFRLVEANDELSARTYPLGQHRPKFMFLHAMGVLQAGDTSTFLSTLKEIVQKYPENEITELAAHIIKGLQSGRSLAGTSNPFGTVWRHRSLAFSADSLATDTLLPAFSMEPDTPHLFILAYEQGTVNENVLLYEMARYNFSNFMVKNFDLSFAHHQGIGMLQTTPFRSFDEVRRYFRELSGNKEMTGRLAGLRFFIISKSNYDLLLKYYNFDEYEEFYMNYDK